MDVLDGSVGVDDGGAHARGPHVDDEDGAHGQPISPNGEGRPSLPGLRMPRGSRALLQAHAARRRRRPGRRPGSGARLMPDAVVVADGAAVGAHRLHDRTPGARCSTARPRRRRPPCRPVQGGAAGPVGPAPGEGEVETGAVHIGVATGGPTPPGCPRCPQGGDAVVVEAGQRRPARRDLDGVDHDPGPVQRGQGRHVVAVPHPPLDDGQVEVGGARRRALGVHHGQGGVEQAGIGFVEHDQGARPDTSKLRVDSVPS